MEFGARGPGRGRAHRARRTRGPGSALLWLAGGTLLVVMWCLLLLGAMVAANAAPRTIEIPALSYGPGRWSIIKLTNPSAEARAVTVDVYRQNGDKMALGGDLMLKARETLELRVEAETEKSREMCWARIIDLAGDVEAAAVLEVLRGNSIESFDRPPHETSRNNRWIMPSWSVQDKDLYFLNASDKTVEVAFCTADSRAAAACPKRGGAHYPVPPNQSILLAVGRLHHQYFLTAASARGRAMLVLMVPAAGDRKVFSSDSSIRFGDAAEPR